MRFSIVVLLLLHVIFSSVHVDALHTSGTIGVNRIGSDLPGMPITLSPSAPSQECATLCIANTQCRTWVYQSTNCNPTKYQYQHIHDITLTPKRHQHSIQPMQSNRLHDSEYLQQSRTAYASQPSYNISSTALCWLKFTIPPITPASCFISGIPSSYLGTATFTRYPYTQQGVIPDGWIHQELSTQVAGLAGHLHLFWADVQHSAWIGGTQDTGLHERLPYWLNGVVPMLYQLQHAGDQKNNITNLIHAIEDMITYILQHQHPNGWLGPTDVIDPWSKMPLLFSFFPYIENNPSLTSTIIPAIYRFLHAEFDWLSSLITSHAKIGYDWWNVRSQDIEYTLTTLYDYYPEYREHQFLLDFTELLQSLTFDWKNWYRYYMPTTAVTRDFNLTTHGVNSAMALKASSVLSRFTHLQDDVDAVYDATRRLYHYHGQASGIFACDEHIAGLEPQRGTELCTVVEAMFSFAINMEILGDAEWGDRVESLMFNSLPATLTPDIWAHQYLQQSNEINSQKCDAHVWASDGPYSNIYGLEPNYGCCTANFAQGIPKYIAHMFYHIPSPTHPTIIAALYGPSHINTSVAFIEEITTYPFCTSPCHITFRISHVINPFSFQFRIPVWSDKPTLMYENGTMITFATGAHWESIDIDEDITITLLFDMPLSVERRYNNAASIYYGPLLMSLNIQPNITVLATYAFDSVDLQMEPTTTWTYALVLRDDKNPEQDMSIHIRPGDNPIPTPYVFDPSNPMLWITAKGRLITWDVKENASTAPPPSPVNTNATVQDITLVPFGVSLLRIAEIPTCQQ